MTVSEQIIQVLDNLAQKFGIAINWSNQNVMPYMRELISKFIKWDIATSIIWMFVGIVIIVFGVILTKKAWHAGQEEDFFGDLDEGCTWKFILSVLIVLIGFITVICQSFDICKAIILPEMRIYEYISFLLQTSN